MSPPKHRSLDSLGSRRRVEPHEQRAWPIAKADRWRSPIPGPEEDLRTARVQHRLQLIELARSGRLHDVCAVFVDLLGSERTAAEQPDR